MVHCSDAARGRPSRRDGDGERSDAPGYRPDIDGLRAIAVLAVVGFHAFPVWVKGGFVGVDIFFVISAYLITTLLLLNLRRGRFSYVHFYVRRINRLFPALLLILVLSLVAGWFLLTAFEYKLFGKQVAGRVGLRLQPRCCGTRPATSTSSPS